MITQRHLEQAISYAAYLELTKNIIENASPPAPYDNEKMLAYTQKNFGRMQRISSEIAIDQKLYNLLSSVSQKWIWIILTEPWCGDAAQIVPALCAFAEVNPNIDCKLLLRDENPDVMDAFLTNGGRSIPKLICLNTETLQVIGTWGPRPHEIQKMVDEFKHDTTTSFGEKVRLIHQWYDNNKTHAVQEEFIDCIKQWSNA